MSNDEGLEGFRAKFATGFADALRETNEKLGEVVSVQNRNTDALERILRNVEGPPHLEATLTRHENQIDANKQAIQGDRERIKEGRDEIKDVLTRLVEVEAWRREVQAHDTYTRRDLTRIEGRHTGLDGRVRDEEKRSVKTSVQVGLLWAAAGAVGMSTLGLVIWALKALFGR